MVYEGHLPGESELSAIYEYLIPFVGRWYVLGYSDVKDSGEIPGPNEIELALNFPESAQSAAHSSQLSAMIVLWKRGHFRIAGRLSGKWERGWSAEAEHWLWHIWLWGAKDPSTNG